jgi:hypothetical protein
MIPFDFDSWHQSLEITDQWLFDWRTRQNLSVKEIAARSGLPEGELSLRLIKLRDRLLLQFDPPTTAE